MAFKSDITRLLDGRIDPEELAGAVRGAAQARDHGYDTIAGPVFALITRLIRASLHDAVAVRAPAELAE